MPDFKGPYRQQVSPADEPIAVEGAQPFDELYEVENQPIIGAVLGQTAVPTPADETDWILRPWHDTYGAYMARTVGWVDDTDIASTAYLTGLGVDGLPHAVGVIPLLDNDGEAVRWKGNLNGAFVQGTIPLNRATVAYAASLEIAVGDCLLKTLNGYNSRLTPQWIQLFDAAALPANGAIPVAILYVLPQQNFSFDYGVYGRQFSNGIVVCNSTTGPTKTIGAADCWFDAQYSN